MKLIAGLGNPGPRYDRTRHNVGYDVADRVAQRFSTEIARFERNYEALVGEAQVRDERVWFIKPQTFMNLSGKSVRAVQRFFKLAPDEILVISDDMNLPVGQVRLRASGSDGGQKGLANIMLLLGTQEVPRLRIGIGNVAGPFRSQHALGRFAPDEQEAIEHALVEATDAAACWVERGMETAMNRYNRKKARTARPKAASEEAGEGESS